MIFSVVTPSFNCGPFILENFQSVRVQEFPPDQLEQWVIDGGSTDGTLELIKAQEGIHWVSERDRGLSDAVNKGIARAKGDWIIWLNADDLLAPNACRTFLDYAKRYPDVRIFAGALQYMRADGSLEPPTEGWDYNLNDLLGLRTGINQPSTFIHREAYQKVGGLDISSRYAMDYEWLVRAMHHYRCVPIPQVLAYSRRRAGSITHANMAAQFREFLGQRRKYGRPRLSSAEFRIRFYLYTEWLRQIPWARRCVRRVKRVFGKEPVHPM